MTSQLIELDGEVFFRIPDMLDMPEFLMTLVSDSDHWMFISSRGGMTAGRTNPDKALFPYVTVDKLYESRSANGPKTYVRVLQNGKPVLWEPFADWSSKVWNLKRNLYKNKTGSCAIFEEMNVDLELCFRYSWSFSREFGFVKKTILTNLSTSAKTIELADGFQNLMSSGIAKKIQDTMSSLTDAYKHNSLDQTMNLAAFGLSSLQTDRAEPKEALLATTAWHLGFEKNTVSLSREDAEAFSSGHTFSPATQTKGKKNDYFTFANFKLASKESKTWSLVADVGRDHVQVQALREVLKKSSSEISALLDQETRSASKNLEKIIAHADGLSSSGDELCSWHHTANVLFNIMRGGLPANGYLVKTSDFERYVKNKSIATFNRHSAKMKTWERDLHVRDLRIKVRHLNDKNLTRIATEYLPFHFSRRHGDPSRPWNNFAIVVEDAHRNPLLNYQGNWRDIFQNWEALGYSFPDYFESFISIFLSATTLDGYNPYRISRDGVDWEVVEPDNPWSNIGYWNDHQIIYLQKFFEALKDFHPERLVALFEEGAYTYANVPYRIAPYGEILKVPTRTIRFDEKLDAKIRKSESVEGSDARLIHTQTGEIYHGTLLEKLLLLYLTKLSNLVPDGGIWLNTQRPEWNDANNALVGAGLSMVTLYQMRRFVAFWIDFLEENAPKLPSRSKVAEEIVRFFQGTDKVLKSFEPQIAHGFDAQSRRSFMDAMGHTATEYREQVYRGPGFRVSTEFNLTEVREFLSRSLRFLEASIRSNRLPSGLYHSYNLLTLPLHGSDRAEISTLYLMLEGQVAALGSGSLSPEQSLELCKALRSSALFREDQHSYLLYPNRELPDFFMKNRIEDTSVSSIPFVHQYLESGDRRLFRKDSADVLHFAPDITNKADLEAVFDSLTNDGFFVSEVDRQAVADVYERCFNHKEFTGRSGSMFAYEGLGSIYWHMVSKLLLSVQETWRRAQDENVPLNIQSELAEFYRDVRKGLGYRKDSRLYGAFPTDPYSHTPTGAGAQQPGMTGQVKEEILTRLGEQGLRIAKGRLLSVTKLLCETELDSAATDFGYLDANGNEAHLALQKGEGAFTFCQIPVVYNRGEGPGIQVEWKDGKTEFFPKGLPADLSSAIFERTSLIRCLRLGKAEA